MFILTENMLPCIVPGENIWRMESNRKCNKTIFGQLYDDRYEKKMILILPNMNYIKIIQ